MVLIQRTIQKKGKDALLLGPLQEKRKSRSWMLFYSTYIDIMRLEKRKIFEGEELVLVHKKHSIPSLMSFWYIPIRLLFV